MAKGNAKAAAPAPEKKEKKSTEIDSLRSLGVVGWLVIMLVAGLLFFVSHYAVTFLLLGMSPALIARIVDKRIGKSASRTIGAFNFMGIIPFLFDLLGSVDKATRSKQIVYDVQTWFWVYSAATSGWLVIWMVPQISAGFFAVKAERRIKKIEVAQELLVTEWGYGITEGTKDYNPPDDE